jgi:hypothetical protein
MIASTRAAIDPLQSYLHYYPDGCAHSFRRQSLFYFILISLARGVRRAKYYKYYHWYYSQTLVGITSSSLLILLPWPSDLRRVSD